MQRQAPKAAPSVRQPTSEGGSERIAKRLARAGLCSRREAETWIAAGRVAVNGKILASPACNVGSQDRIEVDGQPLAGRERTRLWLFHKPRGLVTTARDPQGRPTVFSALPAMMPRVVSVGRLDLNSEGLLLLTNDGGLARILELPDTGWLRRYRVRVHGEVDGVALARLADGVAVDGVLYGPIEATLDRRQGTHAWLTVGLREGKNREIRKVLGSLGLTVSRLIRVGFGPFQLAELGEGEVREIRVRTLRDQLGARLIARAGADFDAPIAPKPKPAIEPEPAAGTGHRKDARKQGGNKRGKGGKGGADFLSRLTTRKSGPKNMSGAGRRGADHRR